MTNGTLALCLLCVLLALTPTTLAVHSAPTNPQGGIVDVNGIPGTVPTCVVSPFDLASPGNVADWVQPVFDNGYNGVATWSGSAWKFTGLCP